MVSKVCYKVADTLNSANEDKEGEEGEGPVTVQILSDYGNKYCHLGRRGEEGERGLGKGGGGGKRGGRRGGEEKRGRRGEEGGEEWGRRGEEERREERSGE